LNLLTDGLLGLGMGVEPTEKDVMKRPPARPSDSIFAGGMVSYIVLVGLLTGAVALTVGLYYYHSGSPYWQTMIFTVLCFSQIGQAFATRSSTESFFKMKLLGNRLLLGTAGAVALAQLAAIYLPFMNNFVYTRPLPLTDLIIVIVASSVVFWAIEIQKFIRRRRGK
jgi:Ca2+-transporting ATPase